jgi:hypothetical protein
MRHRFKVGDIHTATIATEMIDLKTFGNLSNE